jgi:predicted Zn-dependent protease
LLALANSEDKLAGVLGHEVINIARRHSAQEQRQGILPAVLSIPPAK